MRQIFLCYDGCGIFESALGFITVPLWHLPLSFINQHHVIKSKSVLHPPLSFINPQHVIKSKSVLHPPLSFINPQHVIKSKSVLHPPLSFINPQHAIKSKSVLQQVDTAQAAMIIISCRCTSVSSLFESLRSVLLCNVLDSKSLEACQC